MGSLAESGQSHNPFKDRQVCKGLTHKDLVMFVGLDYKTIVHERLYALGVLEEGERLDFNFPPGRHDNSDAFYLWEGTIGDDWIFVSFINKNGRTSEHVHPHSEKKIVEEYHLLKGRMNLHLGKDGSLGTRELNEKDNFMQVPPGLAHSGSTSEEIGFAIIRMRNSASIHRDQLHLPV